MKNTNVTIITIIVIPVNIVKEGTLAKLSLKGNAFSLRPQNYFQRLFKTLTKVKLKFNEKKSH